MLSLTHCYIFIHNNKNQSSMKLLYAFLASLLLTVGSVSAQRTITGMIEDTDGIPLIGANVQVKDSNTGAITDINGRFTIDVPDGGSVLVISYTGYETQEINLTDLSDYTITLSEGRLLEEVVIVGYGTELKREITSSITSVKAEEIEGLPVQSFDRAIQGKASGVLINTNSGAPGSAATIRIRGTGSISASNDPLIIIDGVQMGRNGQSTQGTANPLSSINPNDIESIEILKDASSTAIYGAQGANGIIVVTTKSGKRDRKPQYSLSYQEGVVQPINLYEMMNSQQYAQIRQDAYVNAGLSAESAIALYGDPNDPNLPFEDWVDVLWNDNASLRTADFSFSGGSDKVDYYSAFSYNLSESQIITNEWERLTGRFNLNADLSDKLGLNLRTSMSWIEQEGTPCDGGFFVNCPFGPSFWSIPSSPALDENGDYNAYPTNGEGHNFNFNELQNAENVKRLGRTWQTISSLGLNYDIVENLSARFSFGLDFVNNRDLNSRPTSIPFFRDAWGGQIFNRDRIAVNYNSFFTLNYDYELNDDNTIGLLGGYEYKREDWSLFDATGRGFADPSFLNLNSASTPFSVAGTSSTNRRQGFFGSAKFDHKDKYIVNATLRYDGSSRFGTSTKYGLFYSGSVAWRIIEEGFMQDSGFDELKLRVSYGVTGNSAIGDFSSLAIFGTSGQYLGAPGLAQTRLANDLLAWEEAAQFNVGLDFAFANNRVYGTIDAYDKNNRNLLLNTQIPQTAGIANSTITENVGKVNNQGIDLELNAVLLNRGGFTVNVGGTFSLQRNKVVELNGGRDTIFAANGLPQLMVGQPISFINALEFAGVNPANGRNLVYDANGIPTYAPGIDDVRQLDGPVPDYFGGFRTEVGYKGFNIMGFVQFQGGNHVLNNDLFGLADGSATPNNQLVSTLDYWKNPGDITNANKPVQGGVLEGVNQENYGVGFGSTRYYSDAGYARLKEVRVTYNIPRNTASSLGLGSAVVFVQGLNMVTWTKFDGIDPEAVSNRAAFTGGASFAFPVGRQFAAGINVSF